MMFKQVLFDNFNWMLQCSLKNFSTPPRFDLNRLELKASALPISYVDPFMSIKFLSLSLYIPKMCHFSEGFVQTREKIDKPGQD